MITERKNIIHIELFDHSLQFLSIIRLWCSSLRTSHWGNLTIFIILDPRRKISKCKCNLDCDVHDLSAHVALQKWILFIEKYIPRVESEWIICNSERTKARHIIHPATHNLALELIPLRRNNLRSSIENVDFILHVIEFPEEIFDLYQSIHSLSLLFVLIRLDAHLTHVITKLKENL